MPLDAPVIKAVMLARISRRGDRDARGSLAGAPLVLPGQRGHLNDHGHADLPLAYVDRFFTGTGTPAIFTLTEKSVLLVVK